MTVSTPSHVLVVNCGSSSVKLALLEPSSGKRVWQAKAERLGEPEAFMTLSVGGEKRRVQLDQGTHERALELALGELPDLPLIGVGHRVVHGGEAFHDSTLIDAHAVDAIEACSELAPLHNPANLAGIRVTLKRLPELKQIAVFDTSFHYSMPERAYLYALPYAMYEQRKIRRYGFHGISHQYVAGRAAELLGKPLADLKLLTAHLGNGVSVTAIAGGRCVDTSMGFTPLEGLVMGTRSGDVDPSLHQHLVKHAGMTLEQVTDMLTEQSGLLGLSGESNDMRTLLELESQGHARAALAIDVFCYRLAKGILAQCAGLTRLDALVFTGGIGENAARVRELTTRHLALLGVALDAERNALHGRSSHGTISAEGSRVHVLVIPTNEELEIARETVRVIG